MRTLRAVKAGTVIGAVVVTLLTGCSEQSSNLTRDVPLPRSGALASLVSARSGIRVVGERFVFDESRLRHGAAPEIVEADAVAFANGFARNFAAWAPLEKSRGATMIEKKMRACGGAKYAASQFASPPADASMSLQRRYGAYWLVPMCSSQRHAVAIFAVSARTIGMTIGRDSSPTMPMGSDIGEIFFWSGIPAGTGDWVSEAPERSVREVLAATGGLLAKQPELVAPDPEQNLPTHAAWHVTVEGARAVSLEGGESTSSAEFAITPAGDFRIPGRRELRALLGPRPSSTTATDRSEYGGVRAVLIPARSDIHRTSRAVVTQSSASN